MARVKNSRSKRDISSAMVRFLAVMGMDPARAGALAREAEAAERRERAENSQKRGEAKTMKIIHIASARGGPAYRL